LSFLDYVDFVTLEVQVIPLVNSMIERGIGHGRMFVEARESAAAAIGDIGGPEQLFFLDIARELRGRSKKNLYISFFSSSHADLWNLSHRVHQRSYPALRRRLKPEGLGRSWRWSEMGPAP
jgi:hypothetical protein